MRLTSIGLSARAEPPLGSDTERIGSDAETKRVDWKKRTASIWIPAVLGLGLLMAFAYLGVRIVAGKSQPPGPVTGRQIPALPLPPSPASPPPSLPAPSPKPAPKPSDVKIDTFTLITPQPGERYLQVAAVSSHMVLTYVDSLHKENLDAVVAPGPTPDLLRILVGPFADTDSLDKARARLQSSGRSPILRSY